jgi:putative (di)nucleoside polyphosphate hydrolase
MTRETATDNRPYRRCVGVMMLNAEGLVFVGKRIEPGGDDWQMPQGGVDPGETPRVAALRELAEEAGTDRVEIIAEAPHWISYDLPQAISQRVWDGRYRGQTQRWFAMRFTGKDSDIALDRHTPEFSAWRWVPMADLTGLITPFKRAVYTQVVQAFAGLAGGGSSKPGQHQS